MQKYHSRFPASTLIVVGALLWAGCAKAPARDAAPPAAQSAAPTAAPVFSPGSWSPSRYVALGDSFTIGTGSPPDRSFPARLAARWSGIELFNLGVNGFTTTDLIDRELPKIDQAHPDFATLAIGANDIVHGVSAETYRAHLRAIWSALSERVPPCHVIALPQPDWSLSPAARAFGAPEVIGAKIRELNAILQQEARAHGGRYVDLFPLMRKQADEGMLASDGLHPSDAAYEAWAVAIGHALDTEPLPASCP